MSDSPNTSGAPSSPGSEGQADTPTTPLDRTRELITHLQNPPTKKRYLRRIGLDKTVFFTAGILAVAFVIWGFVSPESLGVVAGAALTGVMDNFGWLFVIAATVFTIFVIVVAVSRFGRIPLGKDGETPEFRTSSWIAMMFATGMGIGLVFSGVGEPLFFYMSPPPATVDGSTSEAMGTAMGTTLFHWTLYPWAMYAIVGLGVAYGSFRLGRSQLFSSMFTSRCREGHPVAVEHQHGARCHRRGHRLHRRSDALHPQCRALGGRLLHPGSAADGVADGGQR